MSEFSEYPRVLFHDVNEPIAVYSLEEMTKMLASGYKKHPSDFDEQERICKDITYHENEIKKLKDRLIQIQAEAKEYKQMQEEVKQKDVEEISTLAGEEEVAPEEAVAEPETEVVPVIGPEVVATPSSDGSNGDGKFTQPVARRRGRPAKVS